MINSVRNTVLSVLNKNNYGYISPSDFNLYAKQAQMELFEEYFSQYNKVINMENARQSGVDYGNIKRPISETIESFSETKTLEQVAVDTNKFYVPTLTTTGDTYYMINKVLCYKLVGEDLNYLGEAEKVTHSRITMLNASLLTAPSEMFPAWVQEGEVITLYPSTINSEDSLVAQYFRHPKDPKWTYITLVNGEPVFDQSQNDYQDFELPLEDEYKLAMKILQYCGVSIREQEVVQFGMAQEQHEQPTFSQQQ
jgi:hypothetical protein